MHQILEANYAILVSLRNEAADVLVCCPQEAWTGSPLKI